MLWWRDFPELSLEPPDEKWTDEKTTRSEWPDFDLFDKKEEEET